MSKKSKYYMESRTDYKYDKGKKISFDNLIQRSFV